MRCGWAVRYCCCLLISISKYQFGIVYPHRSYRVTLCSLLSSGLIEHLSQRVVEERDAAEEYERLLAERAPSWSFYLFGASWNSAGNDLSRLPARPVEHIVPPFPCCYRVQRPVTVAAAWLYQCQLMAVQFVIMRPVLTLVPLFLKHTGVVDLTAAPVLINGTSINWFAPNLYILFVTNVSVAIAFYGLLSFYHGTEKDLEWCEPWPKFLCIKGVVFCTFWQSLTIQFLSGAGRMDDHSASQIQNLLICIEMFLAAIAHFYIFPHEEWKDGYKREKEKGIMLRDTLALRDFVKDMTLMVTSWNTENEIEALSSEKAKLTSELMNLASRSHHGSGSRRESHSAQGSLNGSPTSHPGFGSGHKEPAGDVERGIGYQPSIFSSFSFDLAGAEHLHRSGSHSMAPSSSGAMHHQHPGAGGANERTKLVSYQSQQLAMRGMRRQGTNIELFVVLLATGSSTPDPFLCTEHSVGHARSRRPARLRLDERSQPQHARRSDATGDRCEFRPLREPSERATHETARPGPRRQPNAAAIRLPQR
jgi:hypothetical protein